MDDSHVPHSDRAERSGTALCLSGGGFRAALFHLGAARRLNELGILAQLDSVSSVSGGSIFAAHLASSISSWPASGAAVDEWDERVSSGFRSFCSRDIRSGPIIERALPWNWVRRSTQTSVLAHRYHSALTQRTLAQLPERPNFIFCATDIVNGVNWVFERLRVGDFRVGYAAPTDDWPISFAVAASSCFPPLFSPLSVRSLIKKRSEATRPWAQVRLSDGGVYDNLGIEPVWKSHRTVLVCDGGAPLRCEDPGLFSEWVRYVDVASNQAHALRLRALIASYRREEISGCYWSIAQSSETGPAWTDCYSRDLVRDIISRVRTDMNGFSLAERAVLENHGYLIADAAIRARAPQMVAAWPPAQVPYPEWLDEEKVRFALAFSHKRLSLQRILRNAAIWQRERERQRRLATAPAMGSGVQ